MPDRQLLLILKLWFNDVIYFYLIRYACQFFTCQKTEHRFHIPVHAVNRVPVHKTSIYSIPLQAVIKIKITVSWTHVLVGQGRCTTPEYWQRISVMNVDKKEHFFLRRDNE